jgi:hypothetical protein
MSNQKLTGGMSRGKQPRVNYKGDTSRSMQKLLRSGKYVNDLTMGKISRMIERIGFDHNILSNIQGGNGVDEYYHLTATEETEVARAVPGTIVTLTDNAGDTAPVALGTAAVGVSTKFMRQDAVISDQLPATTVLASGATATTQADNDNSTEASLRF